MYRELIGELIKNNDWAQLQEPCPERDKTRLKNMSGTHSPMN